MFEPFAKDPDLFLEAAMSLAIPCSCFLDGVGMIANVVALLHWYLDDVNWTGFYFLNGNELALGPFQGLPACDRIPVGKGVCGAAASSGVSIAVEDVHSFPGHIACDSASLSEIVTPVFSSGHLIGVLDIDSPVMGRFSNDDITFLNELAKIVGDAFPSGRS